MTSERGRVLLLGEPADPGLAVLEQKLAADGHAVDRAADRGRLEERLRTAPPHAIVLGSAAGAGRPGLVAALRRLEASPTQRLTPVLVLAEDPDGAPGDDLGLPLVEVLSLAIGSNRLAARVRANVEVRRLLEHGEKRTERLASLLEISRALNSTLDSGAILYIIARKLSEEMELVRCSFIVPDLAQGIGRVIACKDDPNIHALEINIANYPEIIQVLRTGRRVIIEDVEQDPIMAGIRKFADVFRDQSIMTLPLTFHGEISGVLQIRKKGARRGFTPREIEYSELLANAAANALKNAQLYEDIERHNSELRRQKRELEHLSEQMKRKNRELIELQALKEDFMAMIVHDLRSPMMIVQGVLDLLAHRRRGSTEDQELIEDGIGVTKKIVGLISDLLEVAKIESGQLELHLEELDAAGLLEDAAEPYRAFAGARGITLRLDAPADLPRLRGDRRCLGQVVDNLLANAFKFTSEGGTIRLVAEADAGDLRIVVEDTGVGIAPEDLPNIFKKFRQGRRGVGQGSGLGLTIVDLLVSAHGGRVEVESTPGHGSRFVVTLPARAESPAGSRPRPVPG